jgi:hypothetical protein
LTSARYRAIRLCMSHIDDEIRAKTETFVAGLAAVIRQAALEAVGEVLGRGKVATPLKLPTLVRAGRPPAPAAKAAAGRPVKAGPASRASKAAVSRKPALAKRAPGAKRPPGELVKLTEKLGDYIKANPGLRMEAIARALATPTRELNLPIKKLLASKRVRFQGHKRATEYFPA